MRVSFVQKAVGNRNGRVAFIDNRNHGALSKLTLLREDDPFGPKYWTRFDEYEVDMVTLDSLIETHPGVHPSFVKIDVEGAGAMVLEGAISVLKSIGPTVTCEFHSEKEKEDMIRILEECRYSGLVCPRKGVPDETHMSFVHLSNPRLQPSVI